MKIHLGPYLSPIVLHWHRDYMYAKHGYCWDIDGTYKPNKFENVLEKVEDFLQDILNHTINPVLNLRKRKIKVKIHPYDARNAFHTMALVILPLLKEVAEQKQGSPLVDDADAPEELSSKHCIKKNEWDWDDNCFPRWNFVLEEMIFAMENIVSDDWEEKFHSGVIDMDFVKCEGKGNLCELVDGPNNSFKFDKIGYKAYADRIQNGCRLFGRYFQNLWT